MLGKTEKGTEQLGDADLWCGLHWADNNLFLFVIVTNYNRYIIMLFYKDIIIASSGISWWKKRSFFVSVWYTIMGIYWQFYGILNCSIIIGFLHGLEIARGSDVAIVFQTRGVNTGLQIIVYANQCIVIASPWELVYVALKVTRWPQACLCIFTDGRRGRITMSF